MHFSRFGSRQLALMAGGFVIAIIVAVSMLSASLLRTQEIDNWREQLSSLSLVLAEQTNQTLTATQLAVENIVDDVAKLNIRSADDLKTHAASAAFHQLLAARIASLNRADVASIVAASGEIINFSRSYPPPPISLTERDYFQAHRDNPKLGLFISIPVQNKGNGKWVFYVSRRLNDAHGNFAGVALVGISVDLFTEFFERLGTRLGEGASVSLSRDDFSLLTRWPRRDALIGRRNLDGTNYAVIHTLGRKDEVIVTQSPRMPEDNQRQLRMAAVRSVDGYPLIVNVTVSNELVLKTWRGALYAIGASAVGSIAAVVLALVALLRIIAKREESAALLRQSEERYARAVRGTSDGLWEWDLVADSDYLSPRLKELLGVGEHEPVGRIAAFFARIHPDDAQTAHAALRMHLDAHAPFDIELRLQRRDDRYRWFGLRGEATRDAQGKALKMSGIIADIDARKEAESELRRHRDHLEELVEARTTALSIAKEAAESASRAKTTFLANMSHELRTPMNAIIGMTYLLLRTSTETTQRDKLAQIGRSAEHLLEVLNDVLDLSRLEGERLNLEIAEFRLGELVAQIDLLVGEHARAKGLELRYAVDPRFDRVRLLGDARRLKQILLNMVENAIKFTDHGHIGIFVAIKTENSHTLLADFKISDTGVGIDREALPRIFAPFEQADASATRRFGGTGLGLSICRRLIHLMGSEISVLSTQGQGSSFHFALRLSKGSTAPGADLPERG